MSNEINELMEKDPLSLTNDDIRSIISMYREMRSRFDAGNLKAGSIKPKAVPKALKGLDTATLDLDIQL